MKRKKKKFKHKKKDSNELDSFDWARRYNHFFPGQSGLIILGGVCEAVRTYSA